MQKKEKNLCPQKMALKCLEFVIIWHWEWLKCPPIRKGIVIYLNSGIPLVSEKEWISSIRDNINESHRHYAELKKPDTEAKLTYGDRYQDSDLFEVINCWGHRDLPEMTGMFCILMRVVVTWMYTRARIDRYMHFIVCLLYVNCTLIKRDGVGRGS